MKKFFSLLLVLLLITAGCSKAPLNETSWQEQYDLGIRYLSDGNYEEAVIAFTAAIEIDPKKSDTYEKLAEVYIAQGQVEKAIIVLENGFSATQDDDLALQLEELKRTDKAWTERVNHGDGSWSIIEWSDSSGMNGIETWYRPDGSVSHINKYSDGEFVHQTQYDEDGTVKKVEEYDIESGGSREIIYDSNGKICEVNDYDVITGMLRVSFYDETESIFQIIEYDDSGREVKSTMYNPDGTIDRVFEYDE